MDRDQNIIDGIRQILNNFDKKIFGNVSRFCAAFNDFVACEDNDLSLIRIAISSDTYRNIISMNKIDDSTTRALINNLINDYYIREDAAVKAINWLLAALGRSTIDGESSAKPATSILEDAQKYKQKETKPNTTTEVRKDTRSGLFLDNNNLYYSIDADVATLHQTYGNTLRGTLCIPQYIEYEDISYPVVKIDAEALKDNNILDSVTIPSTVTSIGASAFEGCSSLASITIPESVTSIGESAFKDCSSLKSIAIPEKVTDIEKWTFCGCSGLTSATISDRVTSIADHVFYGCSGLTSITMPDRLISIEDYAFYGCSGLTSITIPHRVASIGNYAFYGCSGLTSVTMQYSMKSIGEEAFYNCSSLTSVIIPDSVTGIGDSAFEFCDIQNIRLPKKFKSMLVRMKLGIKRNAKLIKD